MLALLHRAFLRALLLVTILWLAFLAYETQQRLNSVEHDLQHVKRIQQEAEDASLGQTLRIWTRTLSR